MIDADIALVRDFRSFGALGLDRATGQVGCTFGCGAWRGGSYSYEDDNCASVAPRVCPATALLPICAEYKRDGALWLADFEAALQQMLETGYDATARCDAPPCCIGRRSFSFDYDDDAGCASRSRYTAAPVSAPVSGVARGAERFAALGLASLLVGAAALCLGGA